MAAPEGTTMDNAIDATTGVMGGSVRNLQGALHYQGLPR